MEEFLKDLAINSHFLTTYTEEAALLTVMFTDKRCLPWVYENFINIGTSNLDSDTYITFFQPFYNRRMIMSAQECIQYNNINRWIINKKWNGIPSFLIDAIDSGHYSYFSYDTYYTEFSNKKSFIHMLFVYGYDKLKCIFKCIDFMNGQYKKMEISFADLEIAFSSFETSDKWWVDPDVLLLKLKEKIDYTMDTMMLKETLKNFLYCNNSSDFYSNELKIYGLEVYRGFIEYCNSCKMLRIDPRFTGLLWKRAMLMNDRIKYLNENSIMPLNNVLCDSYNLLTDLFGVTSKLSIKYNLYDDNCQNKKHNCLVKIISNFNEAICIEQKATEVFINNLECI